jgi:hypothetical protein
MPQRDPAEAVEVIDLLLEFFADGAHWLQHDFHQRNGRRCLENAIAYVCRKHRIPAVDGTRYYIRHAMPQRAISLLNFNDTCKEFGEMRATLKLAQAMALLDWRRRRERERLAA